MDKRVLAALVLVAAAVVAALLLFSSKDAVEPPSPSLAEQAALDWVLEGSRETTATGDEYAGPFPDQGMPGDPIPSYVVFDRDSEDLFYVVFKQSQDIYTASYALGKQIDDPGMRDLRFGYGWFDLSRPLKPPLQVWKLDGGR